MRQNDWQRKKERGLRKGKGGEGGEWEGGGEGGTDRCKDKGRQAGKREKGRQ